MSSFLTISKICDSLQKHCPVICHPLTKCKGNQFVKLKLLPIFKTNVFELFFVRLKLFYKLLKDKMNMYLHLSEKTIKTILGTILQNQSKIFPYIQNLAYLHLIFTYVINLFKNIPIPDFSILVMFLYF